MCIYIYQGNNNKLVGQKMYLLKRQVYFMAPPWWIVPLEPAWEPFVEGEGQLDH